MFFLAKINDRPIKTNVSLTKRYADDIKLIIKMPSVIEIANSTYTTNCIKNGKTEQLEVYQGISAKYIDVKIDYEGIILIFSYKDLYSKFSVQVAQDKLDALIETLKNEIPNYITADTVDFIPID